MSHNDRLAQALTWHQQETLWRQQQLMRRGGWSLREIFELINTIPIPRPPSHQTAHDAVHQSPETGKISSDDHSPDSAVYADFLAVGDDIQKRRVSAIG